MPGVWMNVIDTEALYLLDEVFNPWDLVKAVHKEHRTWVEWVTDATEWISLYRPVVDTTDAEYDDYCVFSERVYDLTADELLVRRSWAPNDYEFEVLDDGRAHIWTLDPLHVYKIMYHTIPQESRKVILNLSIEKNSTTPGNDWMVHTSMDWDDTLDAMAGIAIPWTDGLGAEHDIEMNVGPLTVHTSDVTRQTGTPWGSAETFSWEVDIDETDFKVFKENDDSEFPGKHVTILDDADDMFPTHTFEGQNSNVTIDVDPLMYSVTSSNDFSVTWPMEAETLHVNYLNHTLNVEISVWWNGSALFANATYQVTVDYDEKLGGRWEHTVVGKDASSVDSMGSALVTAGFKNKQIEIGISDMDMMAEAYTSDVPYVLRRFGDGYTFADYFLDPDDSVPGQRLCIRDDWCMTWQQSSANLIGVGGPLANWMTMYFNDFTDAMLATPWFTPEDEMDGSIWGPTCWNKNYYMNAGGEMGVGYATIGTYKDINGTIGLLIWGLDARDTYYASRFFHEEMIYEFQTFDPCITAVIIEIDYTDPHHPCYDIVEVLGTISEHSAFIDYWWAREWLHDNYWWAYPSGLECCWTIEKGGIHDP
jgi:hypothetical protein